VSEPFHKRFDIEVTTPKDAAIFDRSQIAEKYVAFIDILGFGSRVLENFDDLLDTFEQFIQLAGLVERLRPEVQITVYSDSYLFVSSAIGGCNPGIAYAVSIL